jgi:hypothetical protein
MVLLLCVGEHQRSCPPMELDPGREPDDASGIHVKKENVIKFKLQIITSENL